MSSKTQQDVTTRSVSSATPNTMRAIVQERYGSAEVLHLTHSARPEIADHDVLVEVHAAGFDRGTWHLVTGRPYLIRLGFGIRRPKNPVPGMELAGTVVAVGSAVTRFGVGDEVFGVGKGSFAEYAAAREDKLAHKPVRASFEQAAVSAVSGLTALQGLRDVGHVAPGQKVLIIGASGGVGTYAVQLAKAFGAEVTAVSSTAKRELVHCLGADHVIDYCRDDFADGRHAYDLILDIGGNPMLSRLRRALTPTGTAVIVGGEGAGNWTTGINRQLRAMALSPFIHQRLTMLVSGQNSADLEQLADFIDAGTLTPTIDRTFALSEVPDAMRYLESGAVRGKLAIGIRSQQ